MLTGRNSKRVGTAALFFFDFWMEDKNKYILGNPEDNFFEKNPQFRNAKFLDKKINSYGEKKTSDLAWAAYMYRHPESIFFSMPIDERYEEIKSTYLIPRDSKIDKREFEKFCDEFMRICTSYKTRLFVKIKEKLMQLVDDATEHDQIESMLSKFNRMHESLEKAEVSYKQERDARQTAVRGDKQVNSALSRIKSKAKNKKT